ncbi:MAG: signal peptidase II [Desulfobulbaceae bacterium]|nr:signal peptidase II [Desulfobulbaceae bacterium]MDP2104755.1 signal peptidase II [Desulfobulbaceae bacterium]
MLAAGIIIAVVVSDQLTKAWIMANFAEYQSLEIIPGLFSLTYLTNRGAAFGFLNGDHGAWRHAFFIGVAVLAMVIMLVFLRQMQKEGKWSVGAIALIFGGAAGNLIDRLRFGAVVDFLDFYWTTHHWPAFNVADSAITIGVGIFLILNFLRPHTAGE